MKTTIDLLDALRARAGSDRKASAQLGVSQQTVNRWRMGYAKPDDDSARKVAAVLHLDPVEVAAIFHAARAKTDETRAMWERVARAFGKAAALAIVSATPFLLPAPAQAGAFNIINADNTHCRTKRRRGAWAAAIALILGGCTTIDHHTPAPADWPALQRIEHHVSLWDVTARCYRYMSLPLKLLGSIPMGCAEVNFMDRRCDIYIAQGAPAVILKHERLHCAGHDHPGDSTLRDAWARYRPGA